ncbi:integrase core domain-containing protein [Caballeronia sordidicola]|uniref:integrase core domain-containing protein n=1 Tax=Caballeronia sordidicola TaxID=196367 RepID=UPI0035946CA1
MDHDSAGEESGGIMFDPWNTKNRGKLNYLKAYDSVSHARRSIGDYMNLYNQKRPHSSLADQTPDEAYFAMLPAIKLAA